MEIMTNMKHYFMKVRTKLLGVVVFWMVNCFILFIYFCYCIIQQWILSKNYVETFGHISIIIIFLFSKKSSWRRPYEWPKLVGDYNAIKLHM